MRALVRTSVVLRRVRNCLRIIIIIIIIIIIHADPKTDFNAKWPFKVIYFGVTVQTLRDYILQYNNCELLCEISEAS